MKVYAFRDRMTNMYESDLIDIAVVPIMAGAAASARGVAIFGLGAAASFGAAYAVYQATDRVMDLCATPIIYQYCEAGIQAKIALYKFGRLVTLAAGVGATYLLLTYTAAPMMLAMAAGAAAMQTLDFANDALFTKLYDRPMPHGRVINENAISTLSFIAGTGASLLLSFVCPIPAANTAAGVATTVVVDVALTNIAQKISEYMHRRALTNQMMADSSLLGTP